MARAAVTAAMALAVAVAQSDMDAVYACVVAQLRPTDARLNTTVADARAYLARLNATYYWPDVNYTDQTRADWLTMVHLSRVATMVQAVSTPRSPAFDDAALLAGISGALDVWLARKFTNPNWCVREPVPQWRLSVRRREE